MRLSVRLRSLAISGYLIATILIAGCAYPIRAIDLNGSQSKLWTGRLSLQLHTDPVQSFSASFELKGQPERGELALLSPLGNVLGILRWSPDEALLDSGNQQIRYFSSIDDLMEQTTGAAVPPSALFAWLQGINARVSGWSADLSRLGEGRISATRAQPAPRADLRVVLDQ